MDANALSAANAYKNQLKLLQGAGTGGSEEAQTPFLDLVKEAASGAIDTQKKSEAVQLDSLTGGNVDLTELVTAVSNAELTLSTVIAVRDRVINAYQEIIRMPI